MAAKPAEKDNAPESPSFGAFVSDDQTRQVIKQGATEAGFTDGSVVTLPFAKALQKLQKVPTPRLLIVDLSGSEDPLADLGQLAEVCDEGTQVIAVGDVNDVALYRRLLAFGVEDYLVKPLMPEGVAKALTDAGKPQGEGQTTSIGRLIGVSGARGGVGATTLAVNVAWSLASESKKKVALVDFDLFFGSCGLALDLDLGRGFREALENPSRIDALFIERAMVRSGDNLYILGSEEPLDQMQVFFDPSACELLIDHLRRDFKYVIVDLPRFALRTQSSLLAPPCTVAVVSDPTLPGMRDTMRLVQLMKKTVPNTEVRTVLNRVGANRVGELDRGDFEKGAEIKIDHVIAHDAKNFATSAGTGTPLVKMAARSPAARSIHSLAQDLAGIRSRSQSAAAAGLWARLTGMGG
jgi:pilus assembly protein CpaE